MHDLRHGCTRFAPDMVEDTVVHGLGSVEDTIVHGCTLSSSLLSSSPPLPSIRLLSFDRAVFFICVNMAWVSRKRPSSENGFKFCV